MANGPFPYNLKPGVWPPDDWSPILVEMGRLIFNWNTIEQSLLNTLSALIGPGPKARIATAHMSTNSQLDALRTIANEFYKGDQREHLLHSADVYERLREYRNFFVHSFRNIGTILPSGAPYAELSTQSARGRFVAHTKRIDADELSRLAITCHKATDYFARVYLHFGRPELDEYRTLPEKFPLPDRFQKPRQPILGEQDPPQPSQA